MKNFCEALALALALVTLPWPWWLLVARKHSELVSHEACVSARCATHLLIYAFMEYDMLNMHRHSKAALTKAARCGTEKASIPCLLTHKHDLLESQHLLQQHFSVLYLQFGPVRLRTRAQIGKSQRGHDWARGCRDRCSAHEKLAPHSTRQHSVQARVQQNSTRPKRGFQLRLRPALFRFSSPSLFIPIR